MHPGLKMNAFEHRMWADDRPDTPMTFYLRLRFEGSLEQDAFRGAVKKALVDHPLLRSLASGDPRLSGEKLAWEPAPATAVPYMEWTQGDQAFQEPQGGNGIDIRSEIGVRFFVRYSGGKTTVLAQFHHSAVDARGGARFLEDVLAHYHAALVKADAAEWLRPVNLDLLAKRDEFGL